MLQNIKRRLQYKIIPFPSLLSTFYYQGTDLKHTAIRLIMTDLKVSEKMIPTARSLDNATIERVSMYCTYAYSQCCVLCFRFLMQARFQHNRPRSFSSKNEPIGAPLSTVVASSNKPLEQDNKQHQQRSAIIVTTTTNSNSKQQQHHTQLNQQQQQQPANRYKTELCRPFLEYNHCRYGDKCQFAHGKSDLRTPLRHPRYKTELCRTYHSQGYCPYGARCHFIHSTVEARPSPLVPGNTGGPSSQRGTTPTTPLSSMRISTPSQQTAIPFCKPPLSPSQDSGISSPPDTGTPNSVKVFEYPLSDSNSEDLEIMGNSDWTNPLVVPSASDLQFSCDGSSQWDSSDGFSPLKTPAGNMPSPFYSSNSPMDDLTDHFSSTSLDEFIPHSTTRSSRLPVFNQLNSLSDTALLSEDWW